MEEEARQLFDLRRAGAGGRRRCRAEPDGHPEAEKSADGPPGRKPEFIASANQLTANALPLLMVVPKLRKIAFHQSVKDLQERLVAEIGTFQNRVVAARLFGRAGQDGQLSDLFVDRRDGASILPGEAKPSGDMTLFWSSFTGKR